MTKSVTLIPVLTLLLNICQMVANGIKIVKTRDTRHDSGACSQLWLYTFVMTVYWLSCTCMNAHIAYNLYLKDKENIDKRRDQVILYLQTLFLGISFLCTMVVVLGISDKCDGLMRFTHLTCGYYGIYLFICIVLLIDKNCYCCVISEKKQELDRRVCCWWGLKHEDSKDTKPVDKPDTTQVVNVITDVPIEQNENGYKLLSVQDELPQ